jgi:hypothetical protein
MPFLATKTLRPIPETLEHPQAFLKSFGDKNAAPFAAQAPAKLQVF